MKTFALSNGDLVLNGSHYLMVSGASRMQQQIGLALMEPTGTDRFHPNWGSILDQMIGTSMTFDIRDRVKSEVYRVIKNLAALQNNYVQRVAAANARPTITPDEMIAGVQGVAVENSGDSVNIKITLISAGREVITVSTSVTGN